MNMQIKTDLPLESRIKRIIREQSRAVEDDPLGWPGARGRLEEKRLKVVIAKALLADVLDAQSMELAALTIEAAGMLYAHGYDADKADEVGTDLCHVADSLAKELAKYAEEVA